jgi:peptidoglycan hydrolase-like protein with peptidoglycan-binding domain
MSTVHVVQQGEHLAAIARRYGFADYLKLWDLPENAGLKKIRQNPNILLPGDEVFIPDKSVRLVPARTGQVHQFKLHARPLKLRLILKPSYGQALAGIACELDVAGKQFQLETDSEGRIAHDIPATAKEASLTIKDSKTPLNGIVIPLRVGHLDPVEERSGQISRLTNLGYRAGTVEGGEEDLFTAAVEEFQCDHGLAVDGKCGPRTQAKLVAVHGC